MPSLFPELHLSNTNLSQLRQQSLNQLDLRSHDVDVEDLSDVVLELLSHLSLVPSIEPQGVSPTHPPPNISKLAYESEEEALVDLTRDIPIDYQGWYCNYMEVEDNQSIIKEKLVTLVQGVPNLTPVVDKVDSTIHEQLHDTSTPSKIPLAPRQKLIHESAPLEGSTTTHKTKNTSLSQILFIPRFETNNTRKISTSLHCHNKLLTSAAFAAEVQEKLDRDVAKELAIQERKKSQARESMRKRTKKLTQWLKGG